MPSDFTRYQSDTLFLLIGANPLPNYIAARLLSRASAQIILLASSATSEVAERLIRKLRQDLPTATFQIALVSESDGPAIGSEIDKLAQPIVRTSQGRVVGLNYTGGTKPMSAYAYHTLARLFPSAIFSYLDSRTLRMVIDPGGGTVQRIPVGDAVILTLDDIAELHSYRVKERVTSLRNRILAQAIAKVHLTNDGMGQWRSWLESWKDGAKLPSLDSYPALGPALEAFASVCGGVLSEIGVAQALNFQRLNQCGKYFVGEWLEDYALDAVMRSTTAANIHDYAAQVILLTEKLDFEFDVLISIGYQLFGISCRAASKKDLVKEHLLEVFVRGRQLGGDEARVASISLCNDENVSLLKAEVARGWDAVGKIEIFGRSHIPDLSTHLLRWFREASQEEV